MVLLLILIFAPGCETPSITLSSRKPVLIHHSLGTANTYYLKLGDVLLIDINTKRAEKFRSVPISEEDIETSTLPIVSQPYPAPLNFEHEGTCDDSERRFLEDSISRSTLLVLTNITKHSISNELKYVDNIVAPGLERDNFDRNCRFLLVTTVYSAGGVDILNEHAVAPINQTGRKVGEVIQLGKEQYNLNYDLPLNDLKDFFHFRVFKLEEDATGHKVFMSDNFFDVRLDDYVFTAMP